MSTHARGLFLQISVFVRRESDAVPPGGEDGYKAREEWKEEDEDADVFASVEAKKMKTQPTFRANIRRETSEP